MPAAVNVLWNVAPRASMPLSKPPSEAVTVWDLPSSLVQVTVPPAAIVTARGLNALPASDTVAAVGGGGVTAASADGAARPACAAVADELTTIVPA